MSTDTDELKEKFKELKEEANFLAGARVVTRLVVKHSVGFVVGTSLKTVCPTENKTQQVKLFIGGYALGGMIADQAGDWINKEFDELVTSVRKIKSSWKNSEETPEEKSVKDISPEE